MATILSWALGGVVALAVAIPATIGWFAVRHLTSEVLSEKAIRAIGALERGLAEQLDPAGRQVEAIGRLLAEGRVRADDHDGILALLLAGLAANGEVSSMVYLDRSNPPIGAIRKDDGSLEEPANWPLLEGERAQRLAETAQAEGLLWGEVFYAPTLRDAIVNVRYPVRRDGLLAGLVGAAITVKRLSQLVDTLGRRAQLEGFILYGADKVLAHPDMTERATGQRRRLPLTSVAEHGDATLRELDTGKPAPGLSRAEEAGIISRRVGTGDAAHLVIFKELRQYGAVPWTIGFIVPDGQIDPLLGTMRAMGAAAIVLPLAAFGLALVLGRLLARPILRTTAAVQKISTLDLTDVEPLPRSRVRELDAQATSFNAMLATLRAFGTYVPLGLVQRLIRSGSPDAIASRQRDLTLMFTDIAGFTRLAETLPPNEVADLLNHHFAMLARCVEQEGGTVDKYLGDGMMAFWGAPERTKMRAKRACRSALAMRDEIEADNRRRVQSGQEPIRVRIGVHRGTLIVGNIGAPGRINYTAVGDTTNVAQRLQEVGRQVPEAGDVAIVVSEAVVEQAGKEFVFAPMALINVKGRDEPVQAYSLVGPAPAARAPEEAALQDVA